MSARYRQVLDRQLGAVLWVEFTTERGRMVDYRLVLLLVALEGIKTIRVYDSVHGYNEMHRYTCDGGKQTGAMFHSGSLGEGMRAAIDEIKRSYRGMVEGWGR